MVLDQLNYGASRLVPEDDGSRELAFLLCLPLVDGVFATLLVTGAVNTFSQMINVALTVFAGAGALAVLYSRSEDRRHAVSMINQAMPPVLLGAVTVAAIAPVFETAFDTVMLKYAAALAVTSIGLQLLKVDIADHLPPTAIILTGLILSYRGGGELALTASYLYPSLVTAGLAFGGLYLATYLKKFDMNLRYVEYGGALVLFTMAVSLIGPEIPDLVGPAVIAASVIISLRA